MSNLANRLQLRDLRLIEAISVTGQLALAAERLSMTQPAASRLLAAIEQTIGSRLFLRHPKGMTPTAVGEVLARNAAAILNDLDETLREVDAVGLGRAGTVRVGAVTGAAVAFVVPAVRQLKRDALGADVHVDVAPSDALIDGLMRGEYDFVLSRVPPGTDARQFSIRRGRVESISFLVRSGHPLACGKNPDLDELAGYELVIQASHTPMRQAVEEAFVNRHVPLPKEIVNTTSLLVMIAYLASSNAIAPVSREVAELFGPAGIGSTLQVISIDDPIIVHPYHLISRRNHVISPLAARLRSLVFAGLSDGE
ncbi:MAG: LysR family transcriptional regulator [Notoacmeibacter sp.]|nr:LysR family transcriptional regulator [Notoacmeibacter sp.]MCC0031645.1 LysR family transcriptional regulator [Brucellaceae bacterium]